MRLDIWMVLHLRYLSLVSNVIGDRRRWQGPKLGLLNRCLRFRHRVLAGDNFAQEILVVVAGCKVRASAQHKLLVDSAFDAPVGLLDDPVLVR